MSSYDGGYYERSDGSGFVAFAIVMVFALFFIGAIAIISSSSASPEASVAEAGTLYPEPTNYAVDVSGTLSEQQLGWLNDKLKELDTDQHQIAVAVVKTTAPLDITEYGIKLAEKWKVGGRDTDNGALLIVATEDRQVRIEVGYGLEGDLTDAEAGRILDEAVVPQLKKGDWYAGILAGVNAISKEVNK